MEDEMTTRSLALFLNGFPQTPASLIDPVTHGVTTSITVELKSLFHHYFLAKYGDDAADPEVYEYERHLTTGPDWRFRGAGIGRDKESRRNVSNELGKGFARWFLYEHLGFSYFCPLDDLLNRANHDGSRWLRKTAGDLPDYVCGRDASDLNILEAKGRYRSVGFGNKEFDDFRDQVARVHLLDSSGIAIAVKGFISAARWATEEHPRVQPALFVEDPWTEGRPVGNEGYPVAAGRAMVTGHFASVLAILRLPVHADAIRYARTAPPDTHERRGIWRCLAPELKGREFVGGVLPGRDHVWPWPLFDGPRPHATIWSSPFFLTSPPRFFGLERGVFEQVLAVARGEHSVAGEIQPVPVPEHIGQVSLLRDGTTTCPVSLLEPVGVIEL